MVPRVSGLVMPYLSNLGPVSVTMALPMTTKMTEACSSLIHLMLEKPANLILKPAMIRQFAIF